MSKYQPKTYGGLIRRIARDTALKEREERMKEMWICPKSSTTFRKDNDDG